MIGSLAAFVLSASLSAAWTEPLPLVVGETFEVEALDAVRSVNVILPPDYADKPDETWPIIVQIDGGAEQDLYLANGLEKWNRLWGRSQPAILVGIETVDRQRELLPLTDNPDERAQYPAAGESDAFRSWLSEVVLPQIMARYRHNGTAILVGESAAGHFVVETWLKQPQLFSGYAAISPSLQWNSQALVKGIAQTIDARPPIYLSLADEGGETEQGMLGLLARLDPAQPHCFADRREELRHATSLHGLLPEALQYLLPTEADWLEEFGLGLRCDGGG
ncbi:alpha/beta hydrolase [Qipengyuania sp. DSG2-2]|uniref:alpha/beta hydrolase n=1 Tax=Qipengyuania sp. DGS2-2 TaxID=3349631 RepID=UPI0036D3431B